MRGRGLAFAVVIGAALAAPSAASAANIVVDTNLDSFGSPAGCSLREAVLVADADEDYGGCTLSGQGPKDTILIQSGETYFLTIGGADDSDAGGDLDITGPTTFTVEGEGAATINGDDLDRVIDVVPATIIPKRGNAPPPSLKASRIVVKNGTVAPGQDTARSNGGGIQVAEEGTLKLSDSRVRGNGAGNNGGCACGGGIATSGETHLTNVTIDHNDAAESGGGLGFLGGSLTVRDSTFHKNTAYVGGGIFIDEGSASDSVSITSSTVDRNFATNDGPSTAAGGGGVLISSANHAALVTMTNVTISGNKSNVYGGGIHFREGKLKLNAATITGNTADADGDHQGFTGGSGGGIYADSPLKLKNSVVAGNSASNTADRDCYSGVQFTHSLIGKLGQCSKGAGSKAGLAPVMGALSNNGGPTKTHALKAHSPAIGLAGNDAPAKDQRGVNRDSKPDAGAYER